MKNNITTDPISSIGLCNVTVPVPRDAKNQGTPNAIKMSKILLPKTLLMDIAPEPCLATAILA